MCASDGQTGSGKTHTMSGPEGLIPSIVERAFAKIYGDHKHDYKVNCVFVCLFFVVVIVVVVVVVVVAVFISFVWFVCIFSKWSQEFDSLTCCSFVQVACTYLQIYQDKVYDLLVADPKKREEPLALREHPERGLNVCVCVCMCVCVYVCEDLVRVCTFVVFLNLIFFRAASGVYVEGTSDFVVRSPKEVYDLIKQGRAQLIFAETKMNRLSSRSHAVCQMTIERVKRKAAGM